MAKTLPRPHAEKAQAGASGFVKKLDWRKKMSDHIAWGLLVYTGLQIFVTVESIKGEGSSILPYLALIVLVGGIIPACRLFEKRWEKLSNAQAADPAYAAAFKRDRALVWLSAISFPLILTGLFKIMAGG